VVSKLIENSFPKRSVPNNRLHQSWHDPFAVSPYIKPG